MNKKEWLEAALRKIDAMSKEEFDAAWCRAKEPLHIAAEPLLKGFSVGFTDGESISMEISGGIGKSPFGNEWLPLFFRDQTTAPQGALSSLLAA